MTRPPPHRSYRAAGFTLVEVVVALAIAGIVSLIVMRGIGLTTSGVARLSSHVEGLDQRRSLEWQLRRALGSVAAIPVLAGRPGFSGTPTSLDFLSIVEDGGPGLYRFRLAFDAGRAERPVTLSRETADSAAPPRIEDGVMARHIAGLTLAYFGARTPGETPAWQKNWEGSTEPPLLLRVQLDDGDGAEHPPIVVRLGSGG